MAKKKRNSKLAWLPLIACSSEIERDPETLRRLCRNGEIEARKVHGRWEISPEAWEEHLQGLEGDEDFEDDEDFEESDFDEGFEDDEDEEGSDLGGFFGF